MKIDFHVHTKYSEDTLTSLETLKKVCDKKGLYPVITDHNTIKGALEFRKKFGRCIVGEEIKTLHGEVIGLFLNEEIPAQLSIYKTVDKIKEQGGIVYLPHPFDKRRIHLKRFDFKADIVEVYNSRVLSKRYNEMAEKFARERNLLKAAGSDAHFASQIGICYVEMEDFSSKKEFLQNLSQGKLFVRKRTPLYAYPLTNLIAVCKRLSRA